METGEPVVGAKDGVIDEQTITLEELCRRLNAAAEGMGRGNPNKLLLLNSSAALRTLGQRLEEADKELAELKNTPRIITRVN